MVQAQRRFSVIIPTFQRRAQLVETLERLAGIDAPWPVEVIVVVDGSTDGSAAAIAAVPSPWPTTVIDQANLGSGAARNRGAAEATGDLLLFLDDDMLADPGLLIAHDKAHRAGADAVVGHIPLAPGGRTNLLTMGYAHWAQSRLERLNASGGVLTVGDLLTGQLSISSELFSSLSGFDESLTARGRFGGEDTDFLVRLLRSGKSVIFTPEAVSFQRYDVDPLRYLGQWEQAGQTDAELSRRHPGLGGELWEQHGGETVTARWSRALGRLVPSWLLSVVDRGIAHRVEAGRSTGQAARWAFLKVRDLHYWRGVERFGGLQGGEPKMVVLAYHGIDDIEDPLTGDFAVPPAQFAAHLEGIRAAGWRFIDGGSFLAHIEARRPVTGRSVLLTFDDGYCSVRENAAPILQRFGAPGVTFVVSALLGGVNRWDVESGARVQALLSPDQLASMAAVGWEIGAHSRTHAHLTQLTPAQLREEVGSARRELRNVGLPAPRFFAYPYGESSRRVRRAAAAARYSASFSLRTTRQYAARNRRQHVPRLEVRRTTTVAQLLERMESPPTQVPAARMTSRMRLVGRRGWSAAIGPIA